MSFFDFVGFWVCDMGGGGCLSFSDYFSFSVEYIYFCLNINIWNQIHTFDWKMETSYKDLQIHNYCSVYVLSNENSLNIFQFFWVCSQHWSLEKNAYISTSPWVTGSSRRNKYWEDYWSFMLCFFSSKCSSRVKIVLNKLF